MNPEAKDVALFGAAATAILGMAGWMRNRIFGNLDKLGREMAALKDNAAADRLERAAEMLENAKQYATKGEVKEAIREISRAMSAESRRSSKNFSKLFDKLDAKRDR